MNRKPISVLRRLIQALILAAGFAILWFVLVNVVGESFTVGGTGSPDWPPRENLVVRSDGTPLIGSTPRGISNASYRELNGRAVGDTENFSLVDPAWMANLSHSSEFVLFNSLFDFGLPGWENRLKLFVDDQHRGVNWFFVHDGKADGTGYFVGYERADNRIVGYIGRSGFARGLVLPGDRFPVRVELMRSVAYWSAAKLQVARGRLHDQGMVATQPSRLVYVPAQNRLCMVDLSARTVRTIFESPEIIESFTILIESPAERRSERGPIQVVRTTGHLHLLNRQHEVVRTFRLPSEADHLFGVALYEIGDGEAFAAVDRSRVCDADRNIDPKMLYRIAADGTIVDQTELLLESGMLKWHKQPAATVFHWSLPVPIVLPLIEPLMIILIDQENSFASAARSLFRDSWPSLLAIQVLSSLLAAAAWHRARAFALPTSEQFVWFAFIFLTGIPGYVGYRLHRRWPLLQDCPRCRSRVPWDRHVCAACGRPFPSAAVKGIEILCPGELP
jgi:hypothetical protein